MALILALLSICHITKATNWFIGTPIPLSWPKKDVTTPHIDISLQYEINSKPFNWIIKTGVPDTHPGSYDLTTSDFNLLSTASQLNIPQNTTGQFIVSSSTSNQSTNATEILYILQTILLSKSIIGGALTASNKTNTFNLIIANNSCNLTNKYKLYASLIQLNTTTLNWNKQTSLDITYGNILPGSLYCTVSNISTTLKSVSVTGGPWYLQIGLVNLTTSDATSYYAINYNNSNLNDQLYQFIAYDATKVTFQLNQYANIKKYQDITLSVSNALDDIDIYLSLFNQTNKQRWFFNCGQKTKPSFFTSFGWQFLNLNSDNDNISNGNYLFDMYWAAIDNKSEPETFKIFSSAAQNAVIINSSSNIIPGFVLTNDNNFTFHPGDVADFIISSSSFQTPVNLTIWFWQCIADNCNIIGPEYKVLYSEKNQKININISAALQTNAFITDLITYINITIDFCLQKNVSVLIQNVEIIPFYRDYILGNSIGNISWNNNSFQADTVSVLLFYKNKLDKVFNSLPLGIVQNNGSFNSLMPNFTANATHLLIDNNCSGFIQLSSRKQLLNLTIIVYTLFQPLIITKSVNGSTIPFGVDITNTTILSITGLIEQSIYATSGLNWIVYLTNITNRTSLTFDTTNEYALKIFHTNVSGCSNPYTTITYCKYNISFENIFITKTGINPSLGTYILTINYCKRTIQPPYISNYYSINNFNNSGYYYSPFLLYLPEYIHVSINNMEYGRLPLISYKDADMSVSIESQPIIKSVYVVLEDINSSNKFILECAAHLVTYYNSFGWRFEPAAENDANINVINGSYELNIYWNTTTTLFTPQYKLETSNLSSLIINVTMLNNNSIDIIRVNDNSPLKLKKGNTYNIYFTSSLNSGSKVEIYFQQCHNETGIIQQCKDFYSQNNKPQNFTFKQDDQMVLIRVPNDKDFENDEENNYKLATFMVMKIPLCNSSNVIITKQEISVISNSSSPILTAGAIIGLICSAVLVLGLAGWWLFMRNSSGDGYRTLNE